MDAESARRASTLEVVPAPIAASPTFRAAPGSSSVLGVQAERVPVVILAGFGGLFVLASLSLALLVYGTALLKLGAGGAVALLLLAISLVLPRRFAHVASALFGETGRGLNAGLTAFGAAAAAIALLALGLFTRQRAWRTIAFAALAATGLKLVAYDLQHAPLAFRFVSFAVFGSVLLGGAIAYQVLAQRVDARDAGGQDQTGPDLP